MDFDYDCAGGISTTWGTSGSRPTTPAPTSAATSTSPTARSAICVEADDYWFTDKERDSETGLDYFGARYHGSAIGRFTSVDPSRESADPAKPQSWNRYAYTLNNPLIYVDPDGESPLIFLARLANHPMTQRALNVAQRYAVQAFNAATRIFNSPAGQEVVVSIGEAVAGADLPSGATPAADLGKVRIGVGRSLGDIVEEGLSDTKTLAGKSLDVSRHTLTRIAVHPGTGRQGTWPMRDRLDLFILNALLEGGLEFDYIWTASNLRKNPPGIAGIGDEAFDCPFFDPVGRPVAGIRKPNVPFGIFDRLFSIHAGLRVPTP